MTWRIIEVRGAHVYTADENLNDIEEAALAYCTEGVGMSSLAAALLFLSLRRPADRVQGPY